MPSSSPLPPELESLNQIYVATCEAFNKGEVSAEIARSTILGLSFTDESGRIWVVDTKSSGKRAAFKINSEKFGNREPVIRDEPQHITEPIPVVIPQNDVTEDFVSRRNFINDLSVKSAIIGVLGASVLYEGFRQLRGSESSSDVKSEIKPGEPSSNATESEVPTTEYIPEEPGWSTKVTEIALNADIEFGRSVDNVPLTFYRRQSGVNGARVLVIGCIHGDEFVGNRVVDILRDMPLDGDIDLWTVRTMNPDGQQLRTRQNANGVDLNRNFPGNWQKIGEPGSWQYAGAASASEPEVQSLVRLGELVRPQFVIWYHQDYFRIGPGVGHDGNVRTKYASLVGLPLHELDCLCGYTGDKPLLEAVFGGTGANWAKSFQGPTGVSMTVEFGPTLSEEDAQRNAQALVAVTTEFF
jgi:hypothetical protein